MHRNWYVVNTPMAAIPVNGVIPLVVDAGPDTRGIAYIAGLRGGQPYIWGFMHNMYLIGNKTGAFGNLDNMANQIRGLIGGVYANAQVIIGGDFNIRPRNPGTASRRMLLACAARVFGGPYTNTTLANPYDFWVTYNNPQSTNADVGVWDDTRVPGASDHAGVSLAY